VCIGCEVHQTSKQPACSTPVGTAGACPLRNWNLPEATGASTGYRHTQCHLLLRSMLLLLLLLLLLLRRQLAVLAAAALAAQML
jgi:hypothetical protein